MPGNSWNPFRRRTADEYAEAEERTLREPPKQITYARMTDPTNAIRSFGNYASKSLGGPSLDPVFDALDLASSFKGMAAKSPSVPGRPSPVSGKLKSAADAATNPLLGGLFAPNPALKKYLDDLEPKKHQPYQPTNREANLLRGMMRDLRGPKRLATKSIQPMQY